MEGAGGRDLLDAYHPGPPLFLKVLVLHFRYMAYLHPLPRESIRDKVEGMEVDLTDGWDRPLTSTSGFLGQGDGLIPRRLDFAWGPAGIRGQGPLGGDQGAMLQRTRSGVRQCRDR